MISFENNSVFHLKQVDKNQFYTQVAPLLIEGEDILCAYQAGRDGIVFTTLRIFSIDVQGMVGKKIDIATLPYKNIQSFSIENAGVGDADGELDIYLEGRKRIRFEFDKKTDIAIIGKTISRFTL